MLETEWSGKRRTWSFDTDHGLTKMITCYVLVKFGVGGPSNFRVAIDAADRVAETPSHHERVRLSDTETDPLRKLPILRLFLAISALDELATH